MGNKMRFTSGFSLVELMVSVGLIGIMGYGLMDYVASNKKGLLQQNTNDNLKDIEQRIISALQSPAAIRASMFPIFSENQKINRCYDNSGTALDCTTSATFPNANFELYTFYDINSPTNSHKLSTLYYDKKAAPCSGVSNYTSQCPYKVITRFRPLCDSGANCNRASSLVFTYAIYENADTNFKKGFNFTTNQGTVYYMAMRDLVAVTNTAQNPPSEGQKPVGLNPDGTFIYDKGIKCERRSKSFSILTDNRAIEAGFVNGQFVAKLCEADEYAIDGTGTCLESWNSYGVITNYTPTLKLKTLSASQIFTFNNVSYPQYWSIQCQDKRTTKVSIEATCCKTTEQQGTMPSFSWNGVSTSNACKIKKIQNLSYSQTAPGLTHPSTGANIKYAPSMLPMGANNPPGMNSYNRNRPFVGDITPSWPAPKLPSGVPVGDYWEIMNLWVSNRLSQNKDSSNNYFDDNPAENNQLSQTPIVYNGKNIYFRPYLPSNLFTSSSYNFNKPNCGYAKAPDDVNDVQDFQQCHQEIGLGSNFSFNPSLIWGAGTTPSNNDLKNWVLSWPIGFDHWKRGFMEWTWLGGHRFTPWGGPDAGEVNPYGAMTENPCQQSGDNLRYEGLAGGEMLWDQFLFVIEYHKNNSNICTHPKTWGYVGANQPANFYNYPSPPPQHPANFLFEKIDNLNPATVDFRAVDVNQSSTSPFPTLFNSPETTAVTPNPLGKFLHHAEDYGLPFPAGCFVGARIRPIIYAPRALCCPNY